MVLPTPGTIFFAIYLETFPLAPLLERVYESIDGLINRSHNFYDRLPRRICVEALAGKLITILEEQLIHVPVIRTGH